MLVLCLPSGLELQMNHISQTTKFLFKIFIICHHKRWQIKLVLNVPFFYVGWKYFLTSESSTEEVIIFGCSCYSLNYSCGILAVDSDHLQCKGFYRDPSLIKEDERVSEVAKVFSSQVELNHWSSQENLFMLK